MATGVIEDIGGCSGTGHVAGPGSGGHVTDISVARHDNADELRNDHAFFT